MSFAYSGHHGWIELKAAITGEAIKLRPGQINWMVKRGGHVYLVIRELNKDKSHSRWVGVHGGAIREFQCAGRIVSRDVAEHPLAISGESFKGVLEALLRQTSLSVASRASGY